MKFVIGEDTSFSKAAIKQIDEQLAQLDAYDESSQEALNSNAFGRAFVSLADTFSGILHTFKTNLLKFPKTLKRSELREFIESNSLKTKTVNGLTYDKVLKMKVSSPSALKVTYATACESISTAYVKLNAVNLAKLTDTTLTNVYKSLSREDSKAGQLIGSAATIIGNTVNSTAPVVAVCQKDFSGAISGSIDFVQAYKTMEEFRQVQTALLNMEDRLQSVADLNEHVTHIESLLKSICDIIIANEALMQKTDVVSLGTVAKGLALIFEAYSMAASRQMTLEHNTVININNLYATVK